MPEPTRAIDAILKSTKTREAKDFAYAYVRDHREAFANNEDPAINEWAVSLLIDAFEAGQTARES
jgi:hypothetical protein